MRPSLPAKTNLQTKNLLRKRVTNEGSHQS
jgi:hypothetical protein